MSERINVCVIGLGNCASSLITGSVSYAKNKSLIGITYEKVGPYNVDSLDFVLGFDVDCRKVGKTVDEAILQKPNCTPMLCTHEELKSSSIKFGKVYKGPVLDGVAEHMLEYPEDNAFRVDGTASLDENEILILLKANAVDVIVNYLPVGSQKAVEFWANMCLKANIPMMNCMPIFIASDPEWAQRFKDANLPICGDDMRSQFGASVLSSRIQSLLLERGLKTKCHIQQNFGGNTDFLNMMDKTRLKSKKISKENVIKNEYSIADKEKGDDFLFAGPSDYISYYGDTKVAYIHIEAENFGGQPVVLDCKLSVTDSANSAGVVIDSVRFLKVAHRLGMKGAILGPSAFYQKTPPVALPFEEAKKMCDELAAVNIFPDGAKVSLWEGID